ncbi:hypothetical protein HXX76_004527 [Chlamydomonas incerta]|uniref:Uncharacterized protein n=1 Tax=Chlamydomonas incerta TaxID=51695 RepID=A0A835TK27_CHLIN|nr:hypothetical protein HXX76_004527 [Chlamydomonas incerta]|eukprot:KAG2439160.1 hypothetical protein HXX76_004527 [Chlamydomonas incerta]
MAAVGLLASLSDSELVSTSTLASRLAVGFSGGGAAPVAAGHAGTPGSGPAAASTAAAAGAAGTEEALDPRVETSAQWVTRRLQEQGWVMQPEPQEWLVQLLVARNAASAQATRQQQQQQQQQQHTEQMQRAAPAPTTAAATASDLPCFVVAVCAGLVPGTGFRPPKSRSPSASPAPALRGSGAAPDAGAAAGPAAGGGGGGDASVGPSSSTPPPAAAGRRRARLRLVPVAELPPGFPRGPADGSWVVALGDGEVASALASGGGGGGGASGDAAWVRDCILELARAAARTPGGYLACVDPGGGMSIDQELYAWVKTSSAPAAMAAVGNQMPKGRPRG